MAMIIDVRTPEEYAEGHVEGAQNININDPAFPDTVKALDHTAEYVLYCRSGARAQAAMEVMQAQGFVNVQNLKTVANASQVLSLPIVRG